MSLITCPICGSNKSSHYFSDNTLTLYKCKDCGVKFQHPMPTPEALNEAYSSGYYDFYYPEKLLEEQKCLFHYRLDILEKLRDGKKGRVLDIGSGKGMFLKAAIERGWDCIGQDFSDSIVQNIKDSLAINMVVCSSLSEAHFHDGSFELVHMNHVLEHLSEPKDALKEVYRILKPGGLFYCEVPRQSNLLNFLSRLLGKKDFGFHYKFVHLFLFDMKALCILLKRPGFKMFSMGIEGISSPHRFVRGIHYTSIWTHLIAKIAGLMRFEIMFGGGNLVAICRK